MKTDGPSHQRKHSPLKKASWLLSPASRLLLLKPVRTGLPAGEINSCTAVQQMNAVVAKLISTV